MLPSKWAPQIQIDMSTTSYLASPIQRFNVKAVAIPCSRLSLIISAFVDPTGRTFAS